MTEDEGSVAVTNGSIELRTIPPRQGVSLLRLDG